MKALFGGAYNGVRVLITGHSGFKGSWLTYWLERMAAKVAGYGLEPPTDPNHASLLQLDVETVVGDIRDGTALQRLFTTFEPEIVFHLAAQATVRTAYEKPVETFEVNVLGTLNLFEACRATPSVRAVVNVTSDKCYENREWDWGYRESDAIGGHDPYSASKGCSELLTASYRASYFTPKVALGERSVLLASCRAGNVIGGGDWAPDRLLPDFVRAVVASASVEIRSPAATRPWQHVLEPLSGYLLVGERLLAGDGKAATAWNFGPDAGGTMTVADVASAVSRRWPGFSFTIKEENATVHEAGMLSLDCSKARRHLGWQSVWDSDETFNRTVNWYRQFYQRGELVTGADLEAFITAGRQSSAWWLCHDCDNTALPE